MEKTKHILGIGILGIFFIAMFFSSGCIDTNPLDTDYKVEYSCLLSSGTQYFETRGEAENFVNNLNKWGTCKYRITEVGDMV